MLTAFRINLFPSGRALNNICGKAHNGPKHSDAHSARAIGPALAARLHDLGKASPEFQAYISGQGGRRRIDHSTAGARLLLRHWKTRGKEGEHMALWLAYCIAGHHGGLPDLGDGASDAGSLRSRLDPSYAVPDYSAGLDLATPADIPQPALCPFPFAFPENMPHSASVFSCACFFPVSRTRIFWIRNIFTLRRIVSSVTAGPLWIRYASGA